jgi:tetratricopeptide (TPR) repeat protein
MDSEPQQLLDEAVSHLEQAVRQAPGNPRYAALLGEACWLKGDSDAALAPLQSSFSQDPQPRTAWLLARVLQHLGRLPEAESFATAALDDAAGFHRAWSTRATIRRDRCDVKGALADAIQACLVAPGHDGCRRLLEEIFAATDQTLDSGADLQPLREKAAALLRGGVARMQVADTEVMKMDRIAATDRLDIVRPAPGTP